MIINISIFYINIKIDKELVKSFSNFAFWLV